ncbi:MAG: protein kinase [Terriglobia bacterium]|jgi:serine/threonine-protein kinase
MDQKVVQKIGKYEIVSELGQGGMGVVYKARDPFIGRMVALKTITPELVSDPEILKRFYREAQSAGTLQHPNIVTIYDLGEADGHPYIAMEFVEGESLQNIINRRARIPLAAKLKLIQQFCEGLGHAHKHGFVHRDVKPANILVTNDGNVKVVDFGIVHLESTNLTKTGMFLGTIHYASPEQINDGRVDSRSDLWSVTCVAYEFIAYKKAFEGSNIAAIIAKVLSTEPEPLSLCCPGVPAELDYVISKGLKKNLDERYQSLDEMLGDLLPIARGLQQSFIGELLVEAKDLREKGDFTGAQEKVRAILILDNTHGEAKRLHGEVSAEVIRHAPATKAKRLVAEAEQALNRGEYAEAVRILGEAQELNPTDTQARVLKDKVLREQDRLREQERQRQLREALSSGQTAMKQGDLTSAEQELHRALQIDPNNTVAADYLERIRHDRLSRERDFRLKEALWQTDNLVSEGKYEEAQNRLLELQQDFPNSDAVHQKLQVLDPLIRSRKLFQLGEQAFNQGEYAEAVRALGEALELNPQDSEASALKERALQERDRLRQVREALSSGQRAMRGGDGDAAEREFQRALQLDPANTQATSFLGQIRQAQAARERELRFREALQRSDNLVAEGKFEDAQQALLELQQAFLDSAEIDQKLLALDQLMKVRRLMAEGQRAFDQGEFGEAVRILTEAQELDPANAGVRDLRVRAVQERDRLRQVREAISAGQRAMRQGDAGVAERELKRALQLDPANVQATNLLAQVQKEREERERQKRLKEGLSQAENLISGKKFEEAQRKLTELQKAYPDAEEVLQKQLVLTQRRAEAAAPPPAPSPPAEKATPRGTPLSDGAKSMQWAEELRRSLQTPRPPESAPPAKPASPAPTLATPVAQAPVQAPQITEAPKAEPAGEAFGVTMMLGGSLKTHPMAAPEVLPPPPMAPPPRVEPKIPAYAPAPPRVTPTPPAAARAVTTKKSPMIMAAAIVLVVILAISGYLIFHHHNPAAEPGTPQPGVTQNNQEQEKNLFDQAKAAQEAKKWDDAIALYNKVAEMNGPMKDQALQSIPIVTQLRAGADLPKIEKDTFQQATSALQKKEYSQAQGLFQHVIDLKVPDSSLAPRAQTELAKIEPILQAKAEFDAAAGAQNSGDLKGAMARFQTIADKPGPFASEAKARIPKLNEMINNAGATQEFNVALQLEKSDRKGALAKFQAIAVGSGPFKSEAQTHVQQINDQIRDEGVKQQFDAADKAQASGDLPGALGQFKAIAGQPGAMQSQAQQRVQQITDQIAQQQAQQQFNAADRAQSSGDLNTALTQFKALAGKAGPVQAQAQIRAQQVAELIADANKPKAPVTPPPATPAPTVARNAVVTLIPSGDFQRWNGPVSKGQMIPDNSIEGGLKPIGSLTVPPLPDAPAKAVVIFIISIDPNGNVTPGRKTVDDNGLGPQVMAAAKGWKFNPPMVKGKPVATSIQVKVAF